MSDFQKQQIDMFFISYFHFNLLIVAKTNTHWSHLPASSNSSLIIATDSKAKTSIL